MSTERDEIKAGCNCGCGKDRETVVREIARHEGLNYDQAEDRLNRAQRSTGESSHGGWPVSAEHDELFQLMLGRTTTKAVERILAAGYRKPQQVTTVEELDKLGAKSVIIDANGTPLVCDGDAAQPWASVCEDPYGGPIWMDSEEVALPATVLHVGGAE